MREKYFLNRRQRKKAIRTIIYPVWIILGLTIFFGLVIDLPLYIQFIPFLASIVFLGLPHGAVDHLIIPRAEKTELSINWMATVAAIYLVLGGLYLLAWYLAPVMSFVFFILMTWFHWGQGELYILENLVFGTGISKFHKALEVLVRGGAPMILPLVAFPEYYRFVAESLVALFTDQNSLGVVEIFFQEEVRLLLFVIYLALSATLLSILYVKFEGLELRISFIELVLLTFFFLTVPPILAVGVYFCFWHSLRHIFRYSMLNSKSVKNLEQGNLKPIIKDFSLEAAPLTLGALIVLIGLYLALPVASYQLEQYLALYLVLISILTLPHVFIVYLLDKKQGIIR